MERESVGSAADSMERNTGAVQRKKIEAYYDTLLGQGTDALSPDIATYLLLSISMLLLFLPVQEMFAEDNGRELLMVVWMFTLLITMSVTFYMMKYHTVAYGNNKSEAVADVLLYMPIDRKENRKFLFGKLVRFLKKITIAVLIMQVGVALIAYHSFSIWNIIYVLVLTFVAPLVLCGATILLRDVQLRR